MPGAYYNEIEPFCAEWLRNLMRHGLVAPGDVDTRSIEDVRPDDLRGYVQCHFFAGIGVWSRALRLAGWEDSRRVWTGSCPCQPFSSAGQGRGLGDERHLWPAWYHLIGECRPPVVLGEQVASKAAGEWADLVQDDLETLDYAFGAVPFPAASVGAFHIRDRLYWVAHADGGNTGAERQQRSWQHGQQQEDSRIGCGVAHADKRAGRQGCEIGRGRDSRSDAQQGAGLGCDGVALRLADSSSSTRLEGCDARALGHECPTPERGGCVCGVGHAERVGSGWNARAGAGEESGSELWSVGHDSGSPSAVGFWADAEWIPCRDGKWRPVEPGTFPLAHGAPARVGRLRAYGNAIVAPQAEEWIRAVMSCMP